MIPAFFEELAALPRTPNGKINRKALPAPKTQAALPNRPYVAPRNPIETKLAEIWAEVLGRERVGIEDNIFEIGGDSLLIFRIAARANEAGSAHHHPPVFPTSDHRRDGGPNGIRGGPTRGPSAPAPTITAVSRDAYRRAQPAAVTRKVHPYSDAMTELSWQSALLRRPTRPSTEGGGCFCHAVFDQPATVLAARPALSRKPGAEYSRWPFNSAGRSMPAVLERALNAIVARHEILRTEFCAGRWRGEADHQAGDPSAVLT